MIPMPMEEQINKHTLRLIVGLIALSLAPLTSWCAETPISSISASYYEAGWSRDIFVGFLFSISAFLIAYNGDATAEAVLSKLAAGAGLCIALFPCECNVESKSQLTVHGVSATIMFLILAYFCCVFFLKEPTQGDLLENNVNRAKLRPNHLRRLWYNDHCRDRDARVRLFHKNDRLPKNTPVYLLG